jgi:type IV pilus assembly protein PilV
MIEVLVAISVLSVGLLGLAALQGTGMRYNLNAGQRTQLNIAVYDIIDRMRANPMGVNAGSYTISTQSMAAAKRSADPVNCITATCDTNTMATYDLVQWYDILDALVPINPDHLPTIERDPSGRVTITLRWVERGAECIDGSLTYKDLRCQQWVVDI